MSASAARSAAHIITPKLISSIRSRSNLPAGSWYMVTSVALSALNHPNEIPRVLQFALDENVQGVSAASTSGTLTPRAKLLIVRRLREGLVKSIAITGLPKVINSLLALKSKTPADLLDEPLQPSPTGRRSEIDSTPQSAILSRSQNFFDRTYGKVSERVMGQMDRCGTEDLGLTARLMYGYLLSNTNVLSSVETSYVLIAGLIPQDVNPQLKGHLKGALNHGATVDNVRAVRDVVIQVCEACGMRQCSAQEPTGTLGWRDEIANL